MKQLPQYLVATLAAFAATAGATRQTPPATPSQGPLPLAQRVDNVIARQMADRRIPGLSLGVIKDGQLTIAKGYGDATLEWKQPATADTVYLLASMTKQFTATAIMMLAGEGKVGLDDAIGKYVDAPPQWIGITVRQLLTHTAGLKDRFETTADGRMYLDYTTRQMFEAAARTPVDFAPGTKWQYSDQGYFLLGMVIEKASGQSYGAFLKERVFEPAGMTSTTLHNWNLVVPQRADGYSLLGTTVIGSRRRYQFSLVPHFGVQSSVRDLAKYDAALASGTLLPVDALQKMWTPATTADGQTANVAGIGYGLGWFLEQFRGHREVYHGGSTGTCLYRLPAEKVSVIVLTNLEQAAGSDPCGIARMVAAMHEPSIMIVAVPPISETDPARAARLRGAIEAFAKGTPDAGDFVSTGFTAVQAAARSQSAGFAALGPMSSFQLIADDRLAAHVVWYRATYAATTLQYRFVLDKDGRIANLQAR